MARLRALAVVRHATVAAGLGLGWLLLSGSAASASSDLLGTGDLLGTATSAPVTSVAAPVTNTVSQVTTDPVQTVTNTQSAGSTLVQSTTTTLATTVEAVPSVAQPVLTGPLAPLAPVVTGTTSDVGQTITTVGNTLSGTVSTPLPLPAPAPVKEPAPAPAPAADPVAVNEPAPAPTSAAVPTPEAEPGPAAVPAAPPTSTDAQPAGDAAGTMGEVAAWDWSLLGAATAPADGFQHAATGSPTGSPGEPWTSPLLAQPMRLGSGGAGSSGGGLTSPAALVSAFILVPLLLVSYRNRAVGGTVPPSPAFDPGSTPD